MNGLVWVALVVLGIGLGIPRGVYAQASIEVVASARRDQIDTPSVRQRIGLAEDGTIVFAATTPSGPDQLLVAEPGSATYELGISSPNGGDVAINDDSVVFLSGSQVLAMRRDPSNPALSVVQDCQVSTTPCRGGRRLSLSSDGSFAMTAWDSGGGIYRGRVQKGRLASTLDSVPIPSALISAYGIDVRTGGSMLLLGDYAVPSAEVYGAFVISPSRFGWLMSTMVSTRPRGGTEAPMGASFGGVDTFALMPEQTDGMLVLASPALARGDRHAYPTAQVPGVPVLALQSVAGGSMDTNELGLAAVVATLSSGWTGLFTFDTANTSAAPKQLSSLNRSIGRCTDQPISLYVLGTNNAGQIAVLARVRATLGAIDTQVWRVTPTPRSHTTTTFCMASRRLP